MELASLEVVLRAAEQEARTCKIRNRASDLVELLFSQIKLCLRAVHRFDLGLVACAELEAAPGEVLEVDRCLSAEPAAIVVSLLLLGQVAKIGCLF